MLPCPTAEQLAHLLAEELAEPERKCVEGHVETCLACQEILERMTAVGLDAADKVSPSKVVGETSVRRSQAGEAALLERVIAAPPDSIWPTLPGYDIAEVLGRGGMGVVYKAWQRQPHRLVALKMVLAGAHASRDELARFRNEIEAVARLHDPHIVQIYEVGEYEHRPYFSMDFADGGTLAEKLQGTPLPARQAAELVQTLARAVHRAHEQGIIHRDLKPANILLQRKSESQKPKPEDNGGAVREIGFRLTDCEPKISDFGLAKILTSGGAAQTQSGAVLGTPSYMPPEQAAGRIRAVGPAADVYALGALLYELLTGRPPFRAETPLETVRQVLSEEPVTPRSLQPRVPWDLQTITLKCLAKEPGKRYQSALALAEDLHRFLVAQPILGRPVGKPERLARWCRRNPGWAAALGLLLLVAVGASLVAFALNASLGRTRNAEHQATDRLFDALVTRAQVGRGSGQPGQRFANLESLRQALEIARAQNRPEADLLQLRNQAVACLALPDLQVETEWEGNVPGTNGLCFDVAFERYARSVQDEGIRVRRLTDHAELFRLPTLPSQRVSRWVQMGFSGNGRYLAAFYIMWAEKRPMEVWELGDGAGRRIVTLPEATGLPVFAADGNRLVAPLPKGEAAIIELPSGQERRRLALDGPAQALALHPGGKLLAVAGGRSTGVRVLDLETGAVAHRLPHPDTVQGLAWSPDGKLLATGCDDNRIRLWDTVFWQNEGECVGHRWEVRDVVFDPTGRWLASSGWDMTLRIWDVGSRRQVLIVENIAVLGFRSQGGLAAVGATGQQVQIWGFRPSEVFRELRLNKTLHASCHFSPDGRWLTTTVAGDLRVWHMETGREVYQQPGQRGVFWDPHGASLVMQSAVGLLRVPVLANASGDEELPVVRFGPPRPLAGLQEDLRDQFMIWVGPEGRRLLLVDPFDAPALGFRVRLLEVDGDRTRVLWENRKLKAGAAAASADGRLVAVGSYGGGRGVSVWEADTGRLVCELPIGDASMAFGADGRRLYTVTGRLSPRGAECRSWLVDSWEPDRALPLKRTSHAPGQLNVAADGMVAVVFTMGDVRLLEPETLAELTTLSAPEPGLLQGVKFSPEGTTLLTSASGAIQLWHLRRLRQELARLGLDWSAREGSAQDSIQAAP
jgi:serine/threonine protein kinase/WD40 repeat protein